MGREGFTAEQHAHADGSFRKWLINLTGSKKVVWSIRTALAAARESPLNIERNPGQLEALEAMSDLVHPATSEPLIELIGGDQRFNGQAVFLTATGRAVEGWWKDGAWKLATVIGRASDT